MKKNNFVFMFVAIVMFIMITVSTVSFSNRLDKIEARQEAISAGLDYITEKQVSDKKEIKSSLEKKQNKINYLFEK